MLYSMTRIQINKKEICFKKEKQRKHFMDFLVAQWLRICLAMQGIQVRSLVKIPQDPTCHSVTKPACYNYHGRASQLAKPACHSKDPVQPSK